MSATSTKQKYLISYFVSLPGTAFPADEIIEADAIDVRLIYSFKKFAAEKALKAMAATFPPDLPAEQLPVPQIVITGIVALGEASRILVPNR